MVKTICLRKLINEEICNIIAKNAEYMHFVRTIEFPCLKLAIEDDFYDWKAIRTVFHRTDAKMSFVFCEFKRYSDFLAPLKLVQENT